MADPANWVVVVITDYGPTVLGMFDSEASAREWLDKAENTPMIPADFSAVVRPILAANLIERD